MTDDKIESFDDAGSAATHGSSEGRASEGLPPIDREWDLPGDALAGLQQADSAPDAAATFEVVDPEAEELTDESSPGVVDVDGVDDEQQLDRATAAAASARSARPVRRTTPVADPAESDADGARSAQSRGGATAASRRPARNARPVRRPTPVVTSEESSVTGGESLDQELGGVSPMAPAAAALSPDRPATNAATAATERATLRPRRRTNDAEVLEADQPSRPSVRDVDHETHRRVGPVEFVRQSAAELRKVIWPTGEELGSYFVVVLVFVLFIIAFVGLLDLFFGWGLLKLLGTK